MPEFSVLTVSRLVWHRCLMVAPIAPVQPMPIRRSHHSAAPTQAVQLQRRLWQAAQTPDLKPSDIAAIARAWCDVNEERRKLAMRPLPKSVDPEKYRAARASRRRGSPAMSEPTESK